MPEISAPSRRVGILGGMGPAATVDFYDKLVRATPAGVDQEHLRIIMWADPTIPNRHAALLEGGEDPSPWLEEGIARLIESGAEILVVPCNTIHAYLPPLVKGQPVEFISIIGATVEAVQRTGPGDRVGLLAADGALASGLYQTALEEVGITPVVPSEPAQRTLMDLVYGVKAGDAGPAAQQRLAALLEALRADGVSTVIAGCTEISVLLADLDLDVQVIDPSEVLALATIERARSHPSP